MSNNHDWPSASANPDSGHTRPRRPSHFPTLLQNLHDHIRSDLTQAASAAQRVRALEVLEQELAEMDADPMGRRQSRRAREPDDEPPRGAESDARTGEDLNSANVRSRRRMIRPSELLARQRMRPHESSAAALQGLQQAAQRMSQANSVAQSLLDEHRLPSFHTPLSAEESDVTTRWRAKRRKLDADHQAEGSASVNYGHFGQIAPGVLKMEVLSCDGGTYSENGNRSWPENVLLSDDSVYCTKSDKCNLVLRHQGGHPFDLSKIVIKAPKSGFDAPVQAGMLFVAMSAGDLLERTQGFEVQYWPVTNPCVRRRGRHSRFVRNETSRTDLRGVFRWSPTDRQRVPDDELHNRDDRTGSGIFSSAPGPFEVTTTFDDDEDEEAEDDRAPFRRPLRSSRLMPGTRLAPWQDPPDEHSDLEEDDLDHDDDDDNESEEDSSADADDDSEDIMAFINPLNPVILPALTMEPSAMQAIHTRPCVTEDDVIRPHAKFFIERDKSMVSIKFDPPVAGKFILLKLWSSQRGGNIDIQNVTVSGFAGPRFFPNFQMR